MESLPYEMVAEISLYLAVDDLASCCAVSRSWRERFGCDEVWRPRCDKEMEEYLRTTTCVVEPKFIIPESENSNLSPIGKWRTAYLREKHLWSNWNCDNSARDEISTKVEDMIFLNNDFVILVYIDNYWNGPCNKDCARCYMIRWTSPDAVNIVKLINTSTVPPSTVAECILDLRCYEVLVVQSDKFLVWDGKNSVLVMTVDFENNTILAKHKVDVGQCERLYAFHTISMMFFGLKGNLLHIWDLDKVVKLKTESFCEAVHLLKVDCDNEFKCLGIIGKHENVKKTRYHFYLYDAKKLKLSSFQKCSCKCIVCFAIVDNYVALAFDFGIRIYDYQTSKYLKFIKTVNWNMHMLNGNECYERNTLWDCEKPVHTVGKSFIFVMENFDFVQFFPTTGVFTILKSGVKCFYCIRNHEKLLSVPQDYFFQRNELWKIMPNSKMEMLYPLVTTSGQDVAQVHMKEAREKLAFESFLIYGINQVCSKACKWNLETNTAEIHTYW